MSRNPNRYRSVAIVEASPASAFRLKARLLSQGYRRVEVFLSEDSFRDAIREGYRPQQTFSGPQVDAVLAN